jgi:2',3'-cyclic-nucleotide 2'-phosphodiesterase (5'-nucleotidase family)
MKTKRFNILLFGVCLLLCLPVSAKDITLLFTHDLHTMFLPHRKQQTGWQGGYARLYTAIEQAQEKYAGQSLLIDAGDFASGSFFFTLFPVECAELQLMAMMGYEVTTLGNHDFDFGVDGLAAAMQVAKQRGGKLPEIVATNTHPDDPAVASLQAAFQSYPVKPYIVLERNGARIGIFGLIGDEAVDDAPAAALVHFENRFEAATRMVKHLREKEAVDLVVCLSHCGTNPVKKLSEDEQLAAKVSGIDIIISGHSHTVLKEPLLVKGTIIASAGCYAEYLGVLTFDTDSKQMREYYLQPIDTTLTPHKGIEEKIASFEKDLNRLYFDALGRHMGDTVLFNATFLAADPVAEVSALGYLIADAYAAAAAGNAGNKAATTSSFPPIGVIPLGTIRDDLFPGWVTEGQIFSILSIGVGPDKRAGYPLTGVFLTGKELWNLCEIDASCAPLLTDAQSFFSGIRYTCNPHRLFCNRVTEVLVKDTTGAYVPVEEEQMYQIVGGLYSVQMLDVVRKMTHGILSLKPKDANGRPLTDYSQQILTDGGFELKEWLALSNYLRALAHRGEAAEVLAAYPDLEPRKIINNSTALGDRLQHPNGFAILVYAVLGVLILALAAGLFFGIRKIYRLCARKQLRQA